MKFPGTIRTLSQKAKNAILRLERSIWTTRALRRLFYDDFGNVSAEAAPFFKWMRHFCHVDRCVYKVKTDGTVDPFATVAAAARLEVYQELVRLLGIDERKLREQVEKIRDEDYNP